MKIAASVLVAFCLARPALAQAVFPDSSLLNVTGEAAVNVMPDRVRLFLGVESRNKDLLAAKTENDAAVRKVIAAARAISIAASDIQTDYIQVDIRHESSDSTLVSYYSVTKDVQILLKNVSQFEELLSRVLVAGANHIHDVEFSTSELRKHRDAARALAVKAAQEKATDLAAAAGLKVVGAPRAVSAYSYGGGSSYGRGRRGSGAAIQNVYQGAGSGGDGIGADGTVALGTIGVVASVSMSFQLQPQP